MDSLTDLEPQFANVHDFWLGYNGEFRQAGEIVAYKTGVFHPVLNGVLRLAGGRPDDSTIVSLRRRMEGVPWSWWVGPDSPRGLGGQLLEHGAAEVLRVPTMAVELDKVVSPSVTGLEIGEVADERELKEWVECYAPSFDLAPDQIGAAVRLEADRLASGDGMVRFIGRIGGESVGTAALFDSHGVAGIYNVTCAQAHRRQGIGAAMTAAALLAGRERGLRFGTLSASEMGRPLYERMGFKTVAEFQIFALPPLGDGER